MPLTNRLSLSLVCTCLSSSAFAQNLCLLPAEPALSAFEPSPDDALEIEAGTLDVGPGGETELSEGIRLAYRDGILTAERMRIESGSEPIDVIGRIAFVGPDFNVFAEDAELNRETNRLTFSAAGFDIPARPARGSAEQIVVTDNRRLSLSDLIFTTCPEDDVDWRLIARELEIDAEEGFGRARGVKLRFKGVPILYAPYFTFPIDDQRKSGFLTPQIAERDRTGLDITVPYYLNLAPNYDLMLEPRYMSDRGTQISSEFRYLFPRSFGDFQFEFLPDDNAANDMTRRYLNLQHETSLSRRWLFVTGIEEVSDSTYFEDMGSDLSVTSLTHLNRFLDLGYHAPRWSLRGRLQNYQTIDALIVDVDQPYERTPQFLFEGSWGTGIIGFDSETELVNFDRDIGITGWRFDSTQELSLRFARNGMYLTPAVALRQTSYWLDEIDANGVDEHSRGLPVSSIDAGMVFERETSNGGWLQTLEPRVLYVRIPFEDQSQLPVFDTVVPDFNLVQLFRKYQFVGPDRVADTNQFSFGITTRLINDATGRQRLSATLGQTRYRDAQQVTLPDEIPRFMDRSDYVAELAVNLSERWNLDVGYQWNDAQGQAARAETRFEYRPQNDRLFGVGYRLREGLLEQGDLSMVWPVGESWRIIGQYSYSLLEKEPLEQFFGLEYEACCWRLRFVGRQNIIRSTGETDSSVSVQLELKGFSQRIATPEELLGRGILGYRGPGTLGGP